MSEKLTTASLQELIEQVLKNKDNEGLWWMPISALFGDLSPYENLRDIIREIILQTEFADMYQKDAIGGTIAFQTACLQAKHFGTKDICDHLKSELLKMVRSFEKESPEEHADNSENSILKRDRFQTVIESAANISIAAGQQSQEMITHFVEILSQVIEIWKDDISDIESMVQRFCKELPVSQAKAFWPLLIRLRAE